MSFDYDAFLSYNRKDAAIVEVIALRLRQEAQLRVFLDKWCLIPGEPWQDDIEKALDKSATCVIFIGPHGPSPWAHMEMRAALELRVGERMLRVIPTLLPGADKKSLPLFLKSFTWVDYTVGVSDEGAYEALRAGICGFELGPLERKVGVSIPSRQNLGVLFADSLLPVPSFQNRPELNDLRSFWTDDKHAGVLALVGIGGSGKTALVCRFLQELPGSGLEHPDIPGNENLPYPEGIFVWSFYDNPNVEAFMLSIYEYLTKREGGTGPARDLTYRVIRFMEQSRFHRVLIVIDGLEVVQEGLSSPGGFGLLRDSSLRHLVRRLAQGGLGFRMIITSRFPFPDLLAFHGAGYWLVETDNLEPLSARSLLKSRGVLGTDADLNALIRDYGNHALTLDHLGTLLRDFFDGDPQRASELPPLGTTLGDAYAEYQAYRLSRIFSFYQLHLPPNELRVLETLCVFRVPVPLTSIIQIFASDEKGEPRAVPQMNEVTIRSVLSQLRSRRLISFYGNKERTTCSVHPAIRDHFYRAMGPASTEIHAAVGAHLIALAERPSRERYALDSFSLDIVEEFIYHTIRSGDVQRALQFYNRSLGGYTHLAWRLADYQRGLRITSLFVDAGGIALEAKRINTRPWHERSLFHLDLGRPAFAESQMRILLKEHRDKIKRLNKREEEIRKTYDPTTSEIYSNVESYVRYKLGEEFPLMSIGGKRAWLFCEAMLLQCLCDALLAQGRLLEAEQTAAFVINAGGEELWTDGILVSFETGSNPYGRRAVARYLLGKAPEALQDFHKAEKIRGRQWGHHNVAIGEYHGAFHIICLARLGKLRLARTLLDKSALYKIHETRPLLAAQFDLAHAETDLMSDEHIKARTHIDSALAWSVQSGHQEVYTRANLLMARASLRNGNLDAAKSMLSEAEQVARACAFKIWLVDILIIAGHLALRNNKLTHATELATEAFEISSDSSCGYNWGMGNAAHLLAEINLEEGNITAAISHAEAALGIRKAIQDPKSKNTQLLAERLKYKSGLN
jgi:tetratricopeptide (TPR) repeat protein